jgi:histone H3/H4
MSKAEAKDAVSKINDSVMSAATMLQDFRDRKGWLALGYDSWAICCDKEFEISYQHAHRLIDAKKMQDKLSPIGEVPALKENALRELKGVPDDKLPEVISQAKANAVKAGRETPTAKDVSAAAKAAKNPAPMKSTTKAEDKKNREAEIHQKHLARVKDVCGKHAYEALHTGVVEMSAPELKAFVDLPDNKMGEIQDLVLAHRHSVKKALQIVNTMVDEDSRFGDVIFQAIASQGIWQGKIQGMEVSVEVKIRR